MSSTKIQAKNLDSSPDGILKFEKERIEIVNLGELTEARVTLQPRWSWKKYVKPRVNINSFQNSKT